MSKREASYRMRRCYSAVVAALGGAALMSSAEAQFCTGNCDGNAVVSINELIRCVRISLGQDALGQCEACDANADGMVVINELILSVSNSLGSCATPSPTPTSGTPATPGATETPLDVRCCLPNPAGDEIECEDRSASECAEQGGVDKGLGVCEIDTCADVPPPNPDVRCCVPSGNDFECEDRNASACTAEGGVNRGVGVCAPDTCDGLVSTDIQCCVPDNSGGVDCEDRTPVECAERGGTNMGPGTCDPDPCNP